MPEFYWISLRYALLWAVLAGLSAGTAMALDPPAEFRLDEDRDTRGSPAGDPPGLDCGDLFYDDGTAENSIFFGGGQAGEEDHLLGVRFELADFGLAPNQVALTGFCISNQIDLTVVGGPWPNEVFVYRDADGLPAIDAPQRRATVLTGDGTGAFEVTFDEPWRIDEPVFWIMVRGDPVNAGEDFNVETDLSSEQAGKSWLTDRGLDFIFQTEQNFMIRANIGPAPAPPPAEPVPALGAAWAVLLALLLIVVAGLGSRRSGGWTRPAKK